MRIADVAIVVNVADAVVAVDVVIVAAAVADLAEDTDTDEIAAAYWLSPRRPTRRFHSSRE